MKNSNVLGKSKGVLIFASNTASINYKKIASQSKKLIEHYLNLPVTIIDSGEFKNSRFNIDTDQFETWHNGNRHSAYQASPYDQTILLDADYLVFDQQLLKILETVVDYKIVRHNQYIDGYSPPLMGKFSIPHLWATVVVFNKTKKSKMLFDLVAKIERNYRYYQKLYNISAGNYRNDYAFTIADNILNGYTQDFQNYITWPMLTINTKIDKLELVNNTFHLVSDNIGHVIPKQNIHIISKAFLQSTDCENLIEAAINA